MTAVVHNVSPGLWRLAWRRLCADRVAMVSLAVVAAFLLMLVLSAGGLIAAAAKGDSAVGGETSESTA